MSQRVEHPLVGFRAFRIKGDRLYSPIITSGPWERTMHATCAPYYSRHESLVGRLRIMLFGEPPHPAPVAGCTCGLYAHYSLDRVERYFEVAGAVVAWGRVLAHPTGFRAEHMRLLALAASPRSLILEGQNARAAVGHAAERLGIVPLEADQLPAFASEFGEVLPESMRGYE